MNYKDERVFFYCCPAGPPEDADYQHLIVQLAEGLKKLDVEFYASHNYWKLLSPQESYLLQCNPEVTHHDCSLVILEHLWYRKNGLPRDLFKPNRKYITVLLDSEDGATTLSWEPEFQQFDLILKTHLNSKIPRPANIHPWAFGLTNRVLRELICVPDASARENALLVNFRHHPTLGAHPVRRCVETKFIPLIQSLLSVDSSFEPQHISPTDSYDYLQWVQSGRRHYPSYFLRLQKSLACAAFGGFFFPPFTHNPATWPNKYWIKAWTKLGWHSNRIFQWDSWRFWEALAAGCATFHVDFDRYGLQLPVMPENWVHYIGVDLDNIQDTIDRLRDQPEILTSVAKMGQAWALENYCPEAIAQRFLRMINQHSRS